MQETYQPRNFYKRMAKVWLTQTTTHFDSDPDYDSGSDTDIDSDTDHNNTSEPSQLHIPINAARSAAWPSSSSSAVSPIISFPLNSNTLKTSSARNEKLYPPSSPLSPPQLSSNPPRAFCIQNTKQYQSLKSLSSFPQEEDNQKQQKQQQHQEQIQIQQRQQHLYFVDEPTRFRELHRQNMKEVAIEKRKRFLTQLSSFNGNYTRSLIQPSSHMDEVAKAAGSGSMRKYVYEPVHTRSDSLTSSHSENSVSTARTRSGSETDSEVAAAATTTFLIPGATKKVGKNCLPWGSDSSDVISNHKNNNNNSNRIFDMWFGN